MAFRISPRMISRAQSVFMKHVNLASTLPLGVLKMNEEMLHFHKSLPKIPVPPLHASLERYLRSVRPLVTDEEYQNTCKVVNEFGASEGVKLHSALVEKSKCTDNWISEWWENSAYLSVRNSLLNYSTCGIFFNIQDFNTDENHLRYSAKMVAGLLDFKSCLDNLSKQNVDIINGQLLDMTQYYDVFAVCRVPGSSQDSHLHTYLDAQPPKHIIVVHNNHFFSCNVYDDHGKALNEEQLFLQLKEVVHHSQELQLPIGLLTTLHRDKWFEAYDALCKYDPINEKSVKAIQKAMFILCLDQPVTNRETLNRMSMVTSHLLHGGGAEKNSGNRWFDKALQIIVNRDGAVGITFEHSAVDGQIFIRISKHMLDYAMKSEISERENQRWLKSSIPKPKKLEFNVSGKSIEDIHEAKKDLKSIVDDLDISCVSFDKFGTDFIKSQNLNPDSFIQLALQLGFYKMYGEPSATYETASTRKFLFGRTEVIRSTSVESVDFCRKMIDKSISPNSKIAALRTAMNAHKEYASQAKNGMAIDRLLLGLKQIALESGMDMPILFEDPGYSKSTNFRISSSQVPFAHGNLGSFGVLVPDGYGCCYNPQPSHVLSCFSASNSCSKTRSCDFSNAVHEALTEMQDVVALSRS